MKWHVVVFAALLAGAIPSQTPTPPAPAGGVEPPAQTGEKGGSTERADAERKIERRAQEMRDQIEKGRQVKSHVRVRVRLKNGNRLTGVVKDGRLVERVDGLRFVDADAREAGAGIRLWYSGGTRSYIFIPFDGLKNYEVVQRLSQKQLMQIEVEMRMAEKHSAERAEAERRAAAASRREGEQPGDPVTGAPIPGGPIPGAPLPGGPIPGGAQSGSGPDVPVPGAPAPGATPSGAEPAPAKTGEGNGEKAEPAGIEPSDAGEGTPEQKIKWLNLLRMYPPAQGWNKEKKAEIQRRFQVIGVQPSDKEKAFVEQFDDWLEACRNNDVDPDEASQGEPKSRREQRREQRRRTRGTRR